MGTGASASSRYEVPPTVPVLVDTFLSTTVTSVASKRTVPKPLHRGASDGHFHTKLLPRTSSIQSMARSHKLKEAGSYAAMTTETMAGEAAPLRSIFNDVSLRLDPLSQFQGSKSTMKRIMSSPGMRTSLARATSESPTPQLLDQITESDNEVGSPVKGGGGGVFQLHLEVNDADYVEVDDTGDADTADGELLKPESPFQLSLPSEFAKPRIALNRLASFEDDEDWGVVSDDENEQSILALSLDLSSSPRAPKPRLSIHATSPTANSPGDSPGDSMNDSYKFTESGTLNVKGLATNIESDESDSCYRERLVFLKKLGSGASGVVYLAVDLCSLTLVAVKIINIFERGKRRQMVHELETLGEISGEGNGNVVKFVDAFGNASTASVGLIVEYMDGGSLDDIVDAGGCSDESVLASITRQMLHGLKFLHDECGQMHRDVKPANVLINRRGEVKISDFGIARNMKVSKEDDEPAAGVEAKTFVGTLTFMSPERINGGNYGFGADVWSAGLTILTTALGKIPLETSGGYWSVMACVREDDAPTLPADGPWSDLFRDFLALCLEKDEKMRPTCAQLLEHEFVKGARAADEEQKTREEAVTDLENILEAIVVHTKKMIERGAVYVRPGSEGCGGSLVNMLSEFLLNRMDLLKNLATQLELDVGEVESVCSKFIHKAAAASYLDGD